MTLVMTLLVRDEVDIVRENLEFHLARGVDHVIATDNGSTDGTTEILEEYARAGVLTLLHEPSMDYLQGPWVNRMAFMARDAMGADWIINNDADEFWLPPAGDLKAVLQGRDARALTCQRHNMIASCESLETGHWRDVLVWRAGRRRAALPNLSDPLSDPMRLPYFLYDLPTKVIVRAHGLVEVAKGCHSARFDPPAVAETCDVTIYHFPLRSAAKFEAAVAHIAQAIARDETLPPATSWKYRRWGQMLADDGDIRRALTDALPRRANFWRYIVGGRLSRDVTMRRALAGLV